MEKLLYITANPKPVEESFCLSVGKAFLDAFQRENPDVKVTKLDLYQADIPHIDVDVFSGWGKLQKGQAFEQLSAEEKRKVSRINELTDQFVAHDAYVFVTPMWNFLFPPKVKTYIDTICIAGKTFKYTADGPIGLLSGHKALHIQSRGGIYSEGPTQGFEFGDRYLRTVLNFVGVTDIEGIIIEGHNQFPEKAEQIKQNAIKEAETLARTFNKVPAMV